MNLFMISLSHESIDEGSSNEQKVCNESIRNSKDQTYSSFICFLALSSVLGCVIVSHYPDGGTDKYKLLFNGPI